MLQNLLENRTCFKLVCGAGNEDVDEVEKLVTIYSLAGCNFFDVCAKEEVVDAAKRGLFNAGIKKDRYICVSVGIDGDPHITKAHIDNVKCYKCEACYENCSHDAIRKFDNGYFIIEERCIGCSKCVEVCPYNCINMESKLINYKEVLPRIIDKGIDCIEFHAISKNDEDVYDKWEIINNLYDGMLCISLDRSELGDKQLKERVSKMIQNRKPYTTIIQADGIAMSGNDDEFGTTLQAVATAQLFQNSKLPVYIMMSGGTNTKSTQLASLCNVYPNAIAVGSYARKIVKDYLLMPNILENAIELNRAVGIAKHLVNTSITNMRNL